MDGPCLIPRSHLRLYVALWLASIVGVLLIKLFVFRTTFDSSRGRLAVAYVIAEWFAVLAAYMCEMARLWLYMWRRHRGEKRLLTILPWHPWGTSWITSRDDLGDPAVRLLKRNVVDCGYFAIAVWVSSLPMFFFLAS